MLYFSDDTSAHPSHQKNFSHLRMGNLQPCIYCLYVLLCVEVLTLVPVDVTLFGNGGFADVIKMRLYCRKVGPKSNTTGVLLGRGKETEGRWSHEDRGRGGTHAAQRRAQGSRGWKRQGGLLP